MAGLMFPSRLMVAGAMVLMLAWPVRAQAGWFVRDNQIAYRLSLQGHDRQALAYWDHSASGQYGRGTSLMRLGRMQEAEQSLREALALAPHKTGFSDQLAMPVNSRPHFMASVWYNLGNVLYAQGELTAARDAWLKALGFEPGHAKARHNLEIVDRLLGAREKKAPPPAGLAGNDKHKKPEKNGGSQAAPPPQPQQHASLPLQLPGQVHQVSSSPTAAQQKGGGKHEGSGTGRSSEPHTAHRVRRPTQTAGQGTTGGGRGQSPETGQGMSRHEAVQQLRLVEEGVSVFLRHRLSEKGHGSSANGGKPW